MNVMDRLTELSRELLYALRHAPWEYKLEMDEEGWATNNIDGYMMN
jgi:RNA:NAD 2'-phosphotransferase (TPT1/KptA family)